MNTLWRSDKTVALVENRSTIRRTSNQFPDSQLVTKDGDKVYLKKIRAELRYEKRVQIFRICVCLLPEHKNTVVITNLFSVSVFSPHYL